MALQQARSVSSSTCVGASSGRFESEDERESRNWLDSTSVDISSPSAFSLSSFLTLIPLSLLSPCPPNPASSTLSVRPAPRAAAPRAAAASLPISRRAHSASTIQSAAPARLCRQLVVAASAQITTASAAAPVRKADGSPLRVMIAGPPAAGKGTQCQRIVEKVRS